MRRRLTAVLFGAIFTAICLELFLALSARLFLVYQEHENRQAALGALDEIRILCVGESTTAVAGDATGQLLVTHTSYPTQLEAILNGRQTGKRFHVYNLGTMGGTSSTVLDRLGTEIRTLRPHMIIAMMGIKDTAQDSVGAESNDIPWYESVRVVKLARWLVEAVQLRANEVPTDIRTVDDIPASLRTPRGQLQAFVRETRMIPPHAPANLPALNDELLIGIYLWDIGRHDQAEAKIRAVIAEHDVGYNVLAQILATDARQDAAVTMIEEAIRKHPEEAMYRVTLAELLIDEGRFDDAQRVLDDAIAVTDSFLNSAFVANYFHLTGATIARARKDYDRAFELLDRVKPDSPGGEIAVYFPPPRMLWHLSMGETCAATERWAEAEKHLKAAIERRPREGAPMWLLSKVYRQTGQHEKEEQLRRQMLSANLRVAEYYELAKLFRLTGDDARIPALFDEVVEKIPVLPANYQRLYALTEDHGVQLLVMQYPSFRLDILHKYAPPHPGVMFVDNEHVFDADPDGYFFEPKFPFSFTHYTQEGARVLAESVADHVLASFGTGSAPADATAPNPRAFAAEGGTGTVGAAATP